MHTAAVVLVALSQLQPLDTAKTKEAVLAAEQALVGATAAKGASALFDVLEPGAAVLIPGQPILRGVDEARSPVMARYGGASSYTWQPAHVVASLDANIGCTVGFSRFVSARDSTRAERDGSYETCWRRGADGVWRIVGHIRADTRNPSAPPTPANGSLSKAPHSATVSRPGDQRIETQDTDAAFAKFAVDSGTGLAFAKYAASDVVNLMFQAYGPAEVQALFAAYPGRYELVWQPMRMFGAASGGLGFNVGHSVSRRIDGVAEERRGKFLTIWRQNADGTWSYIFDLGSPRP